MAVLQSVLCGVLTLTLVTSKPICLSEGGDSAVSSESNESISSEETAPNVEPSQHPPVLPETSMPNALEEPDPPGATAALPHPDLGPSPSTLNTSNPEETQTSADDLQLVPDVPSQTPVGVGITQGMPNYDPANNADPVQVRPDAEVTLRLGLTATDKSMGTCGTNAPHIASAYQEFPKGVTPPFPPHIISPTTPFSTAAPMPIPFSTALTGVPVCFTFQLSTPEPDPPRGDS
ncbi:mucin-2-like [Betta splendens]|uniref:Mucin-2-like n=1 Tax=Betta splendens TaxID=158456 RepID=A0A6P7NI84_BETSP|nr:mucin-2-like [Betta splendens]